MITYEEVLQRLRKNADEAYRAFHKKLLKNEDIRVIGVRTPVLRALAKEWKGKSEIFSFPDEYYEVTFLKCAVAAALDYGEFIKVADGLVDELDNWATCDCFAPKCVASHRKEFFPFIEKYLASEKEFTRRFALVTLLQRYVTKEYLPEVFKAVRAVEEEAPYYVMMAAAWLTAEVLVKYYEEGLALLKENVLSRDVQNKAIQKARESFRLTAAQKETLKACKIS